MSIARMRASPPAACKRTAPTGSHLQGHVHRAAVYVQFCTQRGQASTLLGRLLRARSPLVVVAFFLVGGNAQPNLERMKQAQHDEDQQRAEACDLPKA